MNYIGELNGLHYKQGSHGFAFYLLKGLWIKSDKKAKDIHNEIKEESTRIFKAANTKRICNTKKYREMVSGCANKEKKYFTDLKGINVNTSA